VAIAAHGRAGVHLQAVVAAARGERTCAARQRTVAHPGDVAAAGARPAVAPLTPQRIAVRHGKAGDGQDVGYRIRCVAWQAQGDAIVALRRAAGAPITTDDDDAHGTHFVALDAGARFATMQYLRMAEWALDATCAASLADAPFGMDPLDTARTREVRLLANHDVVLDAGS
jgi:hypothetical protein